MEQLSNFIAGQPCAPRSGRYTQIIDPSTGEAYLEAPLSDAQDVDDAVRAAADAFPHWRATTPGERSLALFRIADALESSKDALVAAESRNTGKPLRVMADEELRMSTDKRGEPQNSNRPKAMPRLKVVWSSDRKVATPADDPEHFGFDLYPK